MTSRSKKILNNVKVVKNFKIGNYEKYQQDDKHKYLAVCISDGTFTRGEIEFIELENLTMKEIKEVTTVVVIDKEDLKDKEEVKDNEA